ncbi:16S rRNA (cytosine(967)-C(5))-methyltransferase RsmB [Garciella nitratireducens]|uniref:16S rRNA (cytosine(967)-C(5))-methyltransferase n=1 Tax=Garciella nitratireducens DSM 15102 TaxID=1121911 RepID=A0A1T4JZ58_9FIRM|nr:16S rRNA (cytosine(967)-C(5))-methyltransferase RsmB [Garciella nitratireducens]SJZ35453.1 NusB antitermination factor [Garciella nitratireducens DSM 15102]
MKNQDSLENPREVALKVLYKIDKNNAYSNICLKKILNHTSLKPLDRAFVTQLVYGVIKNKFRIDWIISQFSNTPIKKISPWVLNILRLGIYQMLYLDKIPQSAAVNESVKLGKKYGHKRISGFINGILRSISRSPQEILQPDKKDIVHFLSIYYSHPKWMVEKWIKEYGKDFTIDLLKKNNEAPSISVRTNTLKISRERLIDLLQKEDIVTKKGEWCPEAIILENISNIDKNKYFKEGLFQVQDQSSMLVAHVLNPKENQLVIDVCAAPGGKTTHIAQKMNNTGKIIARDIYDHKLSLIKQNRDRLGISNIILEKYNALEVDSDLIGQADRVLLDAPCSGLGIIRRKPDLKWNKCFNDIKKITILQYKMLENAGKYLKKGGILVYSTCTINPDENFNIVKKFLNKNSNFKIVPILPICEKMEKHKEIEEGYLQLFPNIDFVDGFFISKIQRFQ